jgi:Domain of unknown function (DUF2019)
MRRDKGMGRGADVGSVLKEYTELAVLHGQALGEFDHKKSNRLHSRITKLYQALRALGPEAQNELLKLLEHPDSSVRCWAAAHALDFAPERGEPVLKQIAAEGPMPLCMSAETVLMGWRAGR